MKKFIKAVGEVDEQLLERYDNIEKNFMPNKRHSWAFKIAAITACFCLIFGSVFSVMHFTDKEIVPVYSGVTNENESSDNSKNENSSQPIYESSNTESNSSQSDVSTDTSDMENSNDEMSSNDISNGDISGGDVSSGESSGGDVSGGDVSSGESSGGDVSDENSVPEDNPILSVELGHTVSNETLWFNPYASDNSQNGGSLAEMALPYVLFERGFTAMGRVKQILPDTYTRVGASAAEYRYRILIMSIRESVYGKNLPSEIYLMVPSYLDVNALLNYEEILFSFSQIGFENYVLANETKKRAESFSMMFETISSYENFCFSPFTNGMFDTSLWKYKGWKNYFYTEEYMHNFFDNNGGFLINIGDTVNKAKETVRNHINGLQYPPLDRVLTYDEFCYDEAKAVIAYCKPFDNGIFEQSAIGTTIFFTRHVYGLETNETIRISTRDGDVTYYGEKFTADDISNLPNIADFFENTDINSLAPMHTSILDNHTVEKPSISGKYVKHGGRIYSIARVVWKITDDRNWYCLDESYFLVSEDGTATLIEREKLKELVGNDNIVSDIVYNQFVEEMAEAI